MAVPNTYLALKNGRQPSLNSQVLTSLRQILNLRAWFDKSECSEELPNKEISNLWSVFSGENWRYVMDDMKNEAPYCTAFPPNGLPSDCGNSAGATLYFLSFVIVNSYLLTNLFVGAIMEYVNSGLLNTASLVSRTDLQTFQVSLLDLFLMLLSLSQSLVKIFGWREGLICVHKEEA